MQVGSWGELQSVVKSGAISLEQAIGLKEGEVTQHNPEQFCTVFPCHSSLEHI